MMNSVFVEVQWDSILCLLCWSNLKPDQLCLFWCLILGLSYIYRYTFTIHLHVWVFFKHITTFFPLFFCLNLTAFWKRVNQINCHDTMYFSRGVAKTRNGKRNEIKDGKRKLGLKLYMMHYFNHEVRQFRKISRGQEGRSLWTVFWK